MSAEIRTTAENIGRTPALNAWIDQRALLYEKDMTKIAQEYCREVRLNRGRQKLNSQTTFPNENASTLTSIDITQKEIDVHFARYQDTQRWIHPCIIVCVSYKSTFDDFIHQTWKLYMIVQVDSDGRPLAINVNDLPDKTLLPELIGLVEHPGGSSAD